MNAVDGVVERLQAYDEMRPQMSEVSAAYRQYAAWLAKAQVEHLCRKKKEAEVLFTRLGITFAVYGEDTRAERRIPSTPFRAHSEHG